MQSIMNNPRPMAALGKQDTGRRQIKHKNTTQHRKLKDESHGLHQKLVDERRCSQGVSNSSFSSENRL